MKKRGLILKKPKPPQCYFCAFMGDYNSEVEKEDENSDGIGRCARTGAPVDWNFSCSGFQLAKKYCSK